MLCPSRNTLPSTRAFGASSCMRFSVRRNVDFPQPDGPIRADTVLVAKASVTSRTPVVRPYQAVTFSTAMRGGSSVTGGTNGVALTAGGGGTRMSGIGPLGAGHDPGQRAEHEHEQDEH